MTPEERERERAEIAALGDLTDAKNNFLIPGGQEEEVDPLKTVEGNPLIPADAYQVPPGRKAAAPVVEVPDKPSPEFVEKVLAKFIEGSNAADYERVKAALKL